MIKCHPDILQILFAHRKCITKIFTDIIGFYDIDYISITIVNPSKEAIIFSSIPSIEYNLINKNLWERDYLNLMGKNKNDIIWWNEDLVIDDIKKKKNNFTLGMSTIKVINNFSICYSFATRSKTAELKSYYSLNIDGLNNIGDYCYKSIRSIYLYYCNTQIPPKICNTTTCQNIKKQNIYLKLIVDNK